MLHANKHILSQKQGSNCVINILYYIQWSLNWTILSLRLETLMIQPLQWIMGQNVLFLILISHILLMMAVSEPRLRFDGACPRAQNAKIRTCWSLQNNNLASDSWTRDWGRSWVGTERAPGSASSPLRLRGEGTVIIKLFAVSDVRTAPQTIISWLCGLVNGAFEGPSSRLCCFASLSVISQRLFFCFFFFGQRELFSMKTP